ncbi:MAG TPA: glycosyltransferase family 39 protein [Chthoniobacterales bacterium]|jgi:hypothetical protein
MPEDDTSSQSNRPWRRAFVLLAFACVFSFLTVSSMRRSSATYDEVAHLPAGYSYLLMDDYRMNTEHPPLIKKLAALPLVFRDTWPSAETLADTGQPAAAQPLIKRSWEMGRTTPTEAQWLFGHATLYSARPETVAKAEVSHPLALDPRVSLQKNDFQNNADDFLFLGRLPMVCLGLMLGLLIFLWAEHLFGFAGGTLALLLYSLDPNFIAHSGLVTTDVGMSLFLLGAVFFLWRTCQHLTWVNGTATALFFGLAFVSKFSAVLLLPMFLLLGIWRMGSSQPWPTGSQRILSTRLQKAAGFTAVVIACMATTWIIIWSCYSFRYSAFAELPPESPVPSQQINRIPATLPIELQVRSDAAARFLKKKDAQSSLYRKNVAELTDKAPLGVVANLVLWCRDLKLLPEAYLHGFAYLRHASVARSSYLLGEISAFGFWEYFLCTFFFKTPILTLAAFAGGLAVAIRRRQSWFFFPLVPVFVYLAVSLASGLNIGHRHLLPIYPFLFVMAGSVALIWKKWQPAARRWTAILAVVLVAVSSTVVLAPPWRPAVVYPHYLSYFNELAGGPRNGYQVLGDSNLDWGQGLPELKEWLDARNIKETVNLCYFGMADPRYYGFSHVKLPGGYHLEPATDFSKAVIPGYVAISATNLQGIYFTDRRRAAWRNFLADAELIDVVGYSIFIFRLERPPRER